MSSSSSSKSSSISLFLLLLIFILSSSLVFASGRRLNLKSKLEEEVGKPDPWDAAATARWLARQNSWGVLSMISSDLGGAPFGNVVSFSDGLPAHGKGVPYFYLTTLDPTARYALEDQRASFAINEFPLGTCGKIDLENPTCAKLTLMGKLKMVERDLPKLCLLNMHCSQSIQRWRTGRKIITSKYSS